VGSEMQQQPGTCQEKQRGQEIVFLHNLLKGKRDNMPQIKRQCHDNNMENPPPRLVSHEIL
jgi:hypothetical protein